MTATDTKHHIEDTLGSFSGADLRAASIGLLNTLGYQSEKTLDLDNTPDAFLAEFDKGDRGFRKDKSLFDDWKEIHLLFQLTDEELNGQRSPFSDTGPMSQAGRSSSLLSAWPSCRSPCGSDSWVARKPSARVTCGLTSGRVSTASFSSLSFSSRSSPLHLSPFSCAGSWCSSSNKM